jgi:electron transfer flavoprotein alpha subunit
MEKIFVILDTIENKLPVSGTELLACAEQLADQYSLEIVVVVAGADVRSAAETIARLGHTVAGLEHDGLLFPNPDLLARGVTELAGKEAPRYFCITHTTRGCHTAALLSVKVPGCACITAVESVSPGEHGALFGRSLFNGKTNILLSADTARCALTVMPGAFPSMDIKNRVLPPGKITINTIAAHSTCSPLKISGSNEGNVRLEESDVIVSAGRGIGTRENLELIRSVARLFPNSAIGASRTVCDLKWLPFAHQVGTTGKTVAPKLYMACGISGAQQHIAGMKGSQTIVAVNKDPQAAIFSISDYIIVEDLTVFLPVLIRKYDKMFRSQTAP